MQPLMWHIKSSIAPNPADLLWFPVLVPYGTLKDTWTVIPCICSIFFSSDWLSEVLDSLKVLSPCPHGVCHQVPVSSSLPSSEHVFIYQYPSGTVESRVINSILAWSHPCRIEENEGFSFFDTNHLLIQPRTVLAFLAAVSHFQLMLALLSLTIPKSFSE